jgi:hypothetical protein
MPSNERGPQQIEAADLFGIKLPDVSKMLCGGFRQFSVERLLRFRVALNQDAEIVAKPHLKYQKCSIIARHLKRNGANIKNKA